MKSLSVSEKYIFFDCENKVKYLQAKHYKD